MTKNGPAKGLFRSASEHGFALVITLTLVALLVLAIFALTVLSRVNSRIATASLCQSQAKQNALLAFNMALGELQRYAGPDNRITGMAGVVGVLPESTFRQWTGVWDGNSPPVWLVSGKNNSITPSLPGSRIKIVSAHSVGAPADTTDQEPVEVGLVDVPGINAFGLSTRTGRIGYWIGDEGVKVSAIIADDEVQAGAGSGRGIRPDFRGLIGSTFDPVSALNSRILSVEQLKLKVTGFSLLPAFHSLTRSHWALRTETGVPRPGNYVVGAFNINTTSEAAWRALLEFPDSVDNPVFGLNSTASLSVARQIRNRIAERGRPFTSVTELTASTIIQQSFDNASPKVTALTQADFINELLPILTTRSDTFRIRGYGDVLDAVDPATVRASAYCEAIVQRTPDPAPAGLGLRFIVIHFRWLGRDDI